MKWAYRNQAGELLFVVCRFDRSDGGKEVLPLTYGDDGRGARWNWKAYPVPRPLYGLPEMAANVVNTVLVVEGEKVADAAR